VGPKRWAKVFFALKDAVDAGMDIPHNEENLYGYDKDEKKFYGYDKHEKEYDAEIAERRDSVWSIAQQGRPGGGHHAFQGLLSK
jgi:hypothetical protein